MDPTTLPRALICIGDRPLDPAALRFANLIINSINLHPVLFLVQPKKQPSDDGQKNLNTARELPGYETADIRIVGGKVKSEIMTELHRQPYHLLVLGTSEREAHRPLSQLSNQLADQAKVNVLLIRNPPKKINQILTCTGGRAVSMHTIQWGLDLAQATQSHMTILHVASMSPAMYTGLPALEENLPQVLSRDHPLAHHLKEVAAMAESANVGANVELRHGMVPEEILRACEMQTYDLVVIGAFQPRSLVDRLALAEVAPKLLVSSNCSTVIVHGEPPTD